MICKNRFRFRFWLLATFWVSLILKLQTDFTRKRLQNIGILPGYLLSLHQAVTLRQGIILQAACPLNWLLCSILETTKVAPPLWNSERFSNLHYFTLHSHSPLLSLQVRNHWTVTFFFNPCLTVSHAFACPASWPHPYDIRNTSSGIIGYVHTLKPLNFTRESDLVWFVALKPIVRAPMP